VPLLISLNKYEDTAMLPVSSAAACIPC
jgi:hypothetical protein